jgi:hypothetical protein
MREDGESFVLYEAEARSAGGEMLILENIPEAHLAEEETLGPTGVHSELIIPIPNRGRLRYWSENDNIVTKKSSRSMLYESMI